MKTDFMLPAFCNLTGVKRCPRCQETKAAGDFYTLGTGRLSGYCADCSRAAARLWNVENPEKSKAGVKKWRANNPEKHRAASKKWAAENPEKVRKANHEIYVKNKAERLAYNRLYTKLRAATDPEFKLRRVAKRIVNQALQRKVHIEERIELLGCSVSFLKSHLEKQFKPGMSWDNYGEWHIDHIKPKKLFTLADPEQMKLCCHFSNLQPLWAVENLRKGARV